MSSENKPVMPPERIEETETEEEIRREEAAKGKGERAFEVFCAYFLGDDRPRVFQCLPAVRVPLELCAE